MDIYIAENSKRERDRRTKKKPRDRRMGANSTRVNFEKRTDEILIACTHYVTKRENANAILTMDSINSHPCESITEFFLTQ